jgi:hypothetical protein
MAKVSYLSEYPTVKRLLADLPADETKKQALFWLGKFEAFIRRKSLAKDLEDLKEKRKNDTNGQVTHWEIMRDFVTDNKFEMSGIAFTSRKNAGTVVRRWYETSNLPIQSRKVAFAKELKSVGKAGVGHTTIADLRALLLNGQPSPMMKAIILIQFQSGMGRSEVMRSFGKDGLEQLMRGTWNGKKYWDDPLGEDVSAWSFEGKTPYPVKAIRIKTGDEFYTFLSRDALEAIKFYVLDREARLDRKLKPTEPLFAERTHLTKIDQNLRAIAERANVNDFVEVGRINQRRYRVHLHGIRGLFNTVCDNAGIADKFTEFMLGHKWQAYNYSHAPDQTDEDGRNIGLEHFRDEYRKAEPRFNVLSNPNGSVAVTRITNLESSVKGQGDEITRLRAELGVYKMIVEGRPLQEIMAESEERRRRAEKLEEKIKELEQQLKPNTTRRG